MSGVFRGFLRVALLLSAACGEPRGQPEVHSGRRQHAPVRKFADVAVRTPAAVARGLPETAAAMERQAVAPAPELAPEPPAAEPPAAGPPAAEAPAPIEVRGASLVSAGVLVAAAEVKEIAPIELKGAAKPIPEPVPWTKPADVPAFKTAPPKKAPAKDAAKPAAAKDAAKPAAAKDAAKPAAAKDAAKPAAAKDAAKPAAPKDAAKPAAAKEAAKPAAAKPAAPKPPEKVTLPSSPPVESKPRALAETPAKGADLTKCASCHASLTADRKPHNPLKDGSCDACHVANPGAVGKCKSPAGSAWKFVAEQPALCQKCHDTSGAAPPHPVIKSQGCTACHDPHASKNPTLLKISPVDALCYKCHAKFDDAEFIHTPIKQGKCLGCHSPHAGDAKPLLIDKRESLCQNCHKIADLTKGHEKHAPVLEGRCLECHDPHRSDYKAQTVEKGKKLCLTCHDSKAKPGPATASLNFRIDLGRKVVHKAVSGGDCQDCHTQQHSSDNPSLLAKSVTETCFKCHTKFDELYKFQHSAAKLGECAVCHDPHSSDNKGLLTAAKINDVCFKCHADDATNRKWVHKPILEKGCTTCHDAHGGDFKFNLADAEVPALCLKCHEGIGQKVKVKHLALERYGCTACHTPHASDNAKGLLKPTNQLCVSCHAQQADGGHVKTFSGRHPLSGVPDPRRKGEQLTCVSCHAPHGSDNPKLFYAGATPQEACKSCH